MSRSKVWGNNVRANRVARGPSRLGLEGRLLSKRYINDDGCWIWTGATIKNKYNSYGVIYNEKQMLVHRVAAHLYLGYDLNSDLQINHKLGCKSTLCFNPEHLYIGDQGDNMIDFWKKRKQSDE